MLGFLFDTDHLTMLERGHPPLLQKVALQPPGAIGISAVTVEEALRGRLGYIARPLTAVARERGYSLLLGTVRLVNQFPLVSYDQNCETVFQQMRGQRVQIGTLDLRIASVAFVNGLILLTRNRRDFSPVPG